MGCNLNLEDSFFYQSFPRIELSIEISARKKNSIRNFALDRVINFSNEKNSQHGVQKKKKNDIRLSTPLFCTATNVFSLHRISVRHNEIRNTIFILAKFIISVLSRRKNCFFLIKILSYFSISFDRLIITIDEDRLKIFSRIFV